MKRRGPLAAGIAVLGASAFWMVLAGTSTGPFLLLAGIGGGLLGWGLFTGR